MGIFDKQSGKPPGDVYRDLRRQALAYRPEGDSNGPIRGVLMEMGMAGGTATLVCLDDGTVSLYLSTGGGVIGAGPHENVRAASAAMLGMANEFAAEFLAACTSAAEFPVPGAGDVFFWLLAPDGVHHARGKQSDLAERRHAFSALFGHCHAVLGAVREVEESGKRRRP